MTANTLQITVSVVVPVFNRSQELRRVLAALARQSLPRERFEMLICDDGSTEDLGTLIDEFRQTSGLCGRHLKQTNQGAGSARNLGLAEASGEIVAFTDSDCEPDENWLVELTEPFVDREVGIVGGLVDSLMAEHLSGRCVNFLMSSSLGAGGARDPRSVIRMSYYPRAGNMAVRRQLAISAGRFPRASHGEDLEFSGKIIHQGYRAEFASAARVLHNEKRSLREVLREAFRKGHARVRLARQCEMHELIHTIPALFCLYLAALPLGCWITREWPHARYFMLLPGVGYTVVLAVLSLQAAIAFRSVAVGVAVPLYTLLLHGGYGMGYIIGWLKLIFVRSAARRA